MKGTSQDDLFRLVQLVIFDFDGVFTDNTVYVTQEGVESVRCWRSDGLGISKLQSAGVRASILSTETNPVVSIRARKLKVSCTQGVEDKKDGVLKICLDAGVDPGYAMFVGNDINDIPAFNVVGVPVAVADAHQDVLAYVTYQTSRPGGFGAVREICDLIVQARQSDHQA